MDFNFLASVDSITNKYLNQTAISSLSEEDKKKFGADFAEVYESMTSMKLLSANLRTSYENTHSDDLNEHASRLGYSIDNRVINMLHVQISDDMNTKVKSAMDNAAESLLQ
ncbi:MAG: hypothetical protein II666_10175 [Butyrivibrio sp.]|jgi:hypothetical protein|nr:hypothetical protein [Butyrivibrio sp.]MBR4640454.1 hypothetical protein [Butyrivibrio sp.]